MEVITVGCDPEFFVCKRPPRVNPDLYASAIEYKKAVESRLMLMDLQKDNIIPICGMLGGTKQDPKPFGRGEGFAHQEDGAAAEFNIPPAKSTIEFMSHVSSAIDTLTVLLEKKGLAPSRTNNLELLAEWTTEHPNLLQIGCDPDYIAYEDEDGRPKARVSNPENVGLVRGAGGHVHVGYPLDLCPPFIMAKLMDLALALPSVQHDKQGKRRAWWGQAGLYRPKPYGIEYRTMSNWWIWSGNTSRSVAARVFALVDSIQKNMIAWQALVNAMNWAALRDVIYREDVKGAGALYKRTCEQFPVYHACMVDSITRSGASE